MDAPAANAYFGLNGEYYICEEALSNPYDYRFHPEVQNSYWFSYYGF